MRLGDLAVLVLEQIGAVAVQDAGRAAGQAGGMLAGLDAVPGGLDADHRHIGIVEERMEQPDRVRSAAHRGDQQVGQAPSAFWICSRASVPITLWKSRTSSG